MTEPIPEYETAMRSALEAAREAGVVLLENLGKVKTIEFKAKNSLVTEVDKLSEKIIKLSKKSNILSKEYYKEKKKSQTLNSNSLNQKFFHLKNSHY